MPDPAPIRYHLDEHMDSAIAEGLREAGIDVSMSADRDLRGATDREQLDFATAEGRVLVTEDVDFLRIAREMSDHAGIVYCVRTKHSIGSIIRFLELLYRVSNAADMRGRIEYLGW